MTDKISPELQSQLQKLYLAKKPEKIRVMIEVRRVPTVQQLNVLAVDYGAEIVYRSRVAPYVSIQVDFEKVERIAALPWVKKVWHVPRVYLAEATEWQKLQARSPTAIFECSENITLMESAKHLHIHLLKDAGYRGNGIIIGVVDGGIDKTHPMLEGQVIAEANFSDDPTIEDKNGHGSWVASCCAGKLWRGLEGMAPEAKLLNGKAFYEGGAYVDQTMAALEWSCEQGAHVISNSWGAMDPYKPERDLINRLRATYGTVFVFAAGNVGRMKSVLYPGGYPEIPAVGSVGIKCPGVNVLADFSSKGPNDWVDVEPDIMAPGGTNNERDSARFGEEFVCAAGLNETVRCWRGTSMSTPHIAGGVALLLEIGVTDPMQALYNTALDLCDQGKDNYTGFGVADFAKASALPLAKYTLTIQTPFAVTYYLNNSIRQAPYSEELFEACDYEISVGETALVKANGMYQIYAFSQWSDGETQATRTVRLTSDLVLEALYRKLNAVLIFGSEGQVVDQGTPNYNPKPKQYIYTRSFTPAVARSFLKFDLSGLQGLAISDAKLCLQVRSLERTEEIEAYSVLDDGWKWDTITWNNKPALGNSLSSVIVSEKGDFQWDVTSFLLSEREGDKILSLCVKNVYEESAYAFKTGFSTTKLPPCWKIWEGVEPYILITLSPAPVGTLEVHAYVTE